MYLGPLPELEVEVSLLLRWEGLWHPQEKESSHFPQGSVAPLQTQLCIFFKSPHFIKSPPQLYKKRPFRLSINSSCQRSRGLLKGSGLQNEETGPVSYRTLLCWDWAQVQF